MKIAITGGIGSGKTTVCRYLEKKGYQVIYADKIAADLMSKGMANYKLSVRHFGEEVLNPQGDIDRKKLRGIILGDDAKRKLLNRLTHPNILAEIFAEVDDYLVNFIELPLVFEEGMEKYFDEVWLVDCSLEEQKRRVLARGGLQPQEIDKFIASQLTREAKAGLAQVILDSESPDLNRRIDELLEKLEDRNRHA